ncbi:DNA primase [Salinimicrobium sp. WS361]|uniref:DNA primase n=1 Tax=Salinimicrobium sp. WS361 TaxID=3425123 RepID=UPI003D6F8B0E
MPFIKPEIVEKVFEASDLVEVIKDFVELKKSGSTWKGLSPFVSENSGSFMVSPAKSIWKCFSSGKGGGHAVSFLKAKEGMSYIQAIEWLAKKYSIEIEYDDSQYAKEHLEKEEKREELRPLLESVIRKYEKEFEKLPADHPAKIEVFEKRKYTPEIVDRYRIGYAPGRKFIYDLCVQSGRKADAMDLGLISENNDKWYDRVIYPLIDRKGNSLFPVGLAGRRLSEDKKYAKWMNSADSELYKKDLFWYGMDKARDEISKRGEAWLVEGYNDVIAWQENGIPNTIASCGTAIARKQMRMLKKLCDKIVFCFDPDGAGKKAMLKYIPEFIRMGFRVQMVFLSPSLDPDDFVRFWAASVEKYTLADLGTNADYRDDGFKFLMQENFKGKDEVDVAKEAKELAGVIARIEDEAMRWLYTEWLAKESGVKITQVKSYLKMSAESTKKIVLSPEEDEFYRLPPTVKEPLDKLRPTIEKYQLFMANNQIWIQGKDGPPYSFKSVSNFSIEIIQHMQDEKFPMKLVRIKNVHGLQRIFDMQSSDMNSPMAFENAVTAHGNFRWKGGRNEHELLKTFLFDGMGTGRKIDVLGWQPEGFWVWNNKISVPSGEVIKLDENGVFEKDEVSYYIPSANTIYRSNLYKYEAQKKVVSLEPKVNFENYTSQVLKVHRKHGMTGILFAVASMFQDIVVSELNFFPMLFLFGPASSGKDQLADVCQSFFGFPQTAINLEGGVSTIKAQVREFAQFSNTISQLSEYKNGDPKLDGVLKGLWDRRGYKRGNIDSHVGTESIPILSAVLMTGNYAPDQEALITRFIWEFMDKTTFNDEEIKDYEKLSDMTKKGISAFTDEFLKHRAAVKNNFKYKFREFKATLGQRRPDAVSRMVANLSVLGTFYQMFANIMPFTFTHQDMMVHFEKTIDMQMNKMDSASTINRWWDCFLASMRGTLADQIRVGRDFKISGDKLYFNFTSCYNRVSRQWYTQYRDNAPAKGVMMDSLKKDSSWIEDVKGTRMAPGKDSKSTSAYVVNIQEIPIKDEIKFAIDFQLNENSLFANPQDEDQEKMSFSPATPGNKNINKDGDELPF